MKRGRVSVLPTIPRTGGSDILDKIRKKIVSFQLLNRGPGPYLTQVHLDLVHGNDQEQRAHLHSHFCMGRPAGTFRDRGRGQFGTGHGRTGLVYGV